MVDAGTISIYDSEFNFYQKGYYWGAGVEFTYNGNNYRWKDKIYKVENGKDSDDGSDWDGSNLTNIL